MDTIVVIAGSACGFEALRRFVTALPTGARRRFSSSSTLAVTPACCLPFWPVPLDFIRHLLTTGPQSKLDHHMLLEPSRVRLNQGPKVHHTRPAADPLFISAAKVYGERVIGIVLSGGGSDGADGLRAIKEDGGTALVQRPQDALTPSMPLSAMAAVHPDVVLSIPEIVQCMVALCS
jgi:two-component system chemotaxis response regulator CheB